MTKSIFAILIAVVLVLVIVVGVISAVNVPDAEGGSGSGSGNVFGDLFGGGSATTTGSSAVTTAPNNGGGSEDTPAFEGQVQYLDGDRWYPMDYIVDYEQEVISSGQSFYVVYLKVKLAPNSLYNITFDTTPLTSRPEMDYGCRYYDPFQSKWENASDCILSGYVADVYTDDEGWLKFDPLYNYAFVQFPTNQKALDFASTLSQKDFSLMITPRQTQVQYRVSGTTSTIPYNVICVNNAWNNSSTITYATCLELKLDPGKKYSIEYDFSKFTDMIVDVSVKRYNFDTSSWELIEFNEDRKGTFVCTANNEGIIRIVPAIGEGTSYINTYDEFVECADLLKKTDFSVKITPIS